MRYSSTCNELRECDVYLYPLKEHVQDLSPFWPGSDLCTVGINIIPIQFTPASINVNLSKAENTFTLPNITDSPEAKNDGCSQVGLEKALCRSDTIHIKGRDCGVKLRTLLALLSFMDIQNLTYLCDQADYVEE